MGFVHKMMVADFHSAAELRNAMANQREMITDEEPSVTIREFGVAGYDLINYEAPVKMKMTAEFICAA